MKTIKAFIIAIIIFIVIVIVYNNILNNVIGKSVKELYYLLDDAKFNSIEAAQICLNNKDSDNIVVLGSSELSGFNKQIVNNGNSNFNMYLVGRGYTQCFQSALTLGAIENEVDMKKVVLILSPQWFENSGTLTSEIFASRFQKNTFNNFIKNENISYEIKQKVIDELKLLEIEDGMQLEKIYKYENAYLNYNVVDRIYLSIVDNMSNTKQKRELIKLLKSNEINKKSEIIKFEDYKFDDLLRNAEKQGIKACTNNEFGIYDEYYDTYIKGNENKDTRINDDFSNDKEYEYFELFLEICNQLEIKPLIINIPVNGFWYDYTGFSKENRKIYYEKIRNITQKYNTELVDFSDCEYEKYFLKDIMHLGWKGWVKVDEAIYKYYNQQ